MVTFNEKFESISDSLAPHKMFKHMMTLVLDFENTFLAQVELKNTDDLNAYMSMKNFKTDYVMVENEKSSCSCKGQIAKCTCHLILYLIRPYALEFFRSL